MVAVRTETPTEFLGEVQKQNAQNFKNHLGIPTLCSAIHKFRSVHLVEKLLKDGAVVNAFTCVTGSRLNKSTRDRYELWGDYTAIHLAVALGQCQIVRLLLAHGADLKLKTSDGVECLDFILNPHLRCYKNSEDDDLELLKLLKKNGVDLSGKDYISHSTVLHRAIISKCHKIQKYLISTGFDVNCVDKAGKSPLHHCTWNDIESARILLQNSADPNAQDKKGNTLYHCVFDKIANITHHDGLPGFLRLLHEFNANPNIQNNSGKTALHECFLNFEDITLTQMNAIEMVDFMLVEGADPNAKDIFKRTPACWLFKNKKVVFSRWTWLLIMKLVHIGIRLDCVDITGTSLLYVLVKRLLSDSRSFDVKRCGEILHPRFKVNVNVQDYYNRTVLHFISAKGNWDLAEVFLRHGAKMDNLDCDGNTPLDVAILCKRWGYARKLLLWPLTVGQRSKNRCVCSSVDDARLENNFECRSLLLTSLMLDNLDNHSEMRLKLQRSDSMPSLKARSEKTKVIPLGSSVKWTKNMLQNVTELVRIESKLFYFAASASGSSDWEIYQSAMPKIHENFLTELNKSSLRRLCEESSLEFHVTEPCQHEHCRVAKQVFSLVSDLATKCSEMDPRLKSELHCVGSSAEGTKMWFPDEFDFFMELVELRDCPCFTTKFGYKRYINLKRYKQNSAFKAKVQLSRI